MIVLIVIVFLWIAYTMNKREKTRKEVETREQFDKDLKVAIEERGKRLNIWKEF